MLGRLINTVLHFFGLELHYYESNEYLISKGRYKWIQEIGINTVLDIGANSGQFATLIHKIIPSASIYSFEPLQGCYQKILKLKKQIPKLICFNIALGEKNESALINRSEFSPSSSLLPMEELHKVAFPYTATTTSELITIMTLDSMSDQIEFRDKILMKIDVQGFEMNVLRGAVSVLSKVDVLIIESSFKKLYKDQPLFSEIYSYLVTKGFIYQGNFDVIIHPLTGEYLQVDAIFVKEIFV